MSCEPLIPKDEHANKIGETSVARRDDKDAHEDMPSQKGTREADDLEN
jgi:hypothetical protein